MSRPDDVSSLLPFVLVTVSSSDACCSKTSAYSLARSDWAWKSICYVLLPTARLHGISHFGRKDLTSVQVATLRQHLYMLIHELKTSRSCICVRRMVNLGYVHLSGFNWFKGLAKCSLRWCHQFNEFTKNPRFFGFLLINVFSSSKGCSKAITVTEVNNFFAIFLNFFTGFQGMQVLALSCNRLFKMKFAAHCLTNWLFPYTVWIDAQFPPCSSTAQPIGLNLQPFLPVNFSKTSFNNDQKINIVSVLSVSHTMVAILTTFRNSYKYTCAPRVTKPGHRFNVPSK